MKDFLEIKEVKKDEIVNLIKKSIEIKKNPQKYYKKLENKTLLLLFEAPSLRTRISFETAMNQLGGSAIYYDITNSPLGKGKESMEDTSKVVSRYCDMVALRIYKHDDLLKFAKNSSVPVVNLMTNEEHPCQIMGDLLIVFEKKKKLNVRDDVLKNAVKLSNDKGLIKIFDNPIKAVKNVDVVYTDSWMSYRIPKDQEGRRVKILSPYQVNRKLMKYANKDALFMHCLPALRGQEVTKEVIDGKSSVVFDQAENRLHIQKAIILYLLNKL